MNTASRKDRQSPRSHRPRASAVFAAAFIAGAAAAVGVNRALDVHIAQSRPKVESEPIFVALRALPQGSPITVWDVALRDWPKAMLPAAAMRPQDSFEGMILRHPLREGQPLLTVQLAKAATEAAGRLAVDAAPVATPAVPAPVEPAAAEPQTDLWAPAEQPTAVQPEADKVATAVTPVPPPAAAEAVVEPAASPQPSTEPVAPEATDVGTADVASVVADPIVAPITVAAAPLTTDVEPSNPGTAAAETVPAPPQSPRFLVVPERIALQADRSFMPPVVGRPAVKEAVRPIVEKPVEVQQTPVRQAGKATPKRQPQRSAANGGRPATATPRGDSNTFGTMFPNLSAGVNAVGEQLDTIKQDRGTAEAAAAKTGTAQPRQPSPAPRSAWLPFFRGQ